MWYLPFCAWLISLSITAAVPSLFLQMAGVPSFYGGMAHFFTHSFFFIFCGNQIHFISKRQNNSLTRYMLSMPTVKMGQQC
jgi:hypothetical protein